MVNKNLTNVRAMIPERDKLKALSRELSFQQRKDVKIPEVLRRTLNIPNLKEVLINDAKVKKKFKKG